MLSILANMAVHKKSPKIITEMICIIGLLGSICRATYGRSQGEVKAINPIFIPIIRVGNKLLEYVK